MSTAPEPRAANGRGLVVNVHEAKTHLSRLLERVEAGETVTIARAGKPDATLVPYRPVGVTVGLLRGTFDFDDEAFNAPDPELTALFTEGTI